MADIKGKFAAVQSFTITLASLGNDAARQSDEINNATNLYLDAFVQLRVKTGASGVSSTGYVEVYAFGSIDGGTLRSDEAGAADAAITLASPPNARLIGRITANANATTYDSHPMSVAAAFGGILPERWGIIVLNKSGAALDGTEGNHLKKWQGVLGQSA